MSSTTLNIPTPIRDISCQELLRRDVDKHGVLRLRGAFNKVVDQFITKPTSSKIKIKWRSVHVVLHKGCLYIYNNEMASLASKATSLFGFSTIKECSDEVAHVQVLWPFKLVSEIDYNEKAFYFSAPSNEEMKNWISVITQQMTIVNNASIAARPPPPVPTVEKSSACAASRPVNDWSKRPHELTSAEKARLNYRTDVPHASADTPADESGDDSDYDVIDEDNITDDSKLNSPSSPVGAKDVTSPTSRASKGVPVMLPVNVCVRPSLTSWDNPTRQPSKVTTPVHNVTKPPPPVPGAKPSPESAPINKSRPPVSQKPVTRLKEDQNKLSGVNAGLVPVSPGYYAVERHGEDGTDVEQTSEFEAYTVGEEYLVMTTSSKKPLPREKSIDEAFWSGSPSDGNTVMRTLTENGVYMIRQSVDPTMCDKLTLLVKVDQGVRKFHIFTNEDDEFAVVQSGPWFKRLTLLLQHYKCNSLPNLSAMLTIPYRAVVSA